MMDYRREAELIERACRLESENERLRLALVAMEKERDYWHEWFVKADETNSLLANSKVIWSSPEL